MDDVVDAKTLSLANEQDPYLTRVRNGEPVAQVLGDAIAALQREAEANGLTDEILDAEIAAWYAELDV